jgi:hypothetical protein
MTRIIAAAVALMVVVPIAVDAHRLDELIQASQVAVTPRSVVVHLGLTPGVALVSQTLVRLDKDGDGRVSPPEAEAYARTVMRDLDARLDGIRLPLSLRRVEVPTGSEMRDGVGTIRLEFSAETGHHATGRHLFELRNGHWPERSEYLANALLPDGAEVTILHQERDATQQLYRLHFETQSRSEGTEAAVMWLLGGIAVLLTHARWRVGSRQWAKTQRSGCQPAGSRT